MILTGTNQFIDLCILLGCDYLEPIKGVGPKSALKLIREHGTLGAVVAHLREKSAEKARLNAKAAASKAAASSEDEDGAEDEEDAHVESEDEDEKGADEEERVDEDGKEKKGKGKAAKTKKGKGKGGKKGAGTGGVQVPEQWLWEEAKKLFEHPDVTPADQIEVSSYVMFGFGALIGCSWNS